MWSRLRAPRPTKAAGVYRRAQSVSCRYTKSSSVADDVDLELPIYPIRSVDVESVPFGDADAPALASLETAEHQQRLHHNEQPILLDSSSSASTMFGGVGAVAAAGRLTPRYRFRDLLMGDFAFNDDGERYVISRVF